MAKILISTTSFGKDDPAPLELCRKGNEVVLNPHGRKLNPSELLELAADVDGIIAGTESIARSTLDKLRRLKVISRCGTGMENVDLVAAAEFGVKVYNTPDAPTAAVAELTIALILDLLRRVSHMDREVRSGTWNKRMGSLLEGKKIGILGFGRIGQRVAFLLAPFGTETAFCDVRELKTVSPCRHMQLAEMLGWADIVTLHCSAPAGGKKVIGREELELLRPGAWLVNTARGELVDEDALYANLKQGRLAGAALDVFEREPYSGPLSKLDNVVLTPHIGSYARESRIEMEMQAARNVLEGLQSAGAR